VIQIISEEIEVILTDQDSEKDPEIVPEDRIELRAIVEEEGEEGMKEEEDISEGIEMVEGLTEVEIEETTIKKIKTEI
jgi:hypothetical protein